MRDLTRKERKLAVFAAIFIAGWSLYTFFLNPVYTRMETLKRVIPEKQAELHELKRKATEYAELISSSGGNSSSPQKLPNNFSLKRYLAGIIDDHQLSQNRKGMTEDQQSFDTFDKSLVTIQIENISLSQLVFLITSAKTGQAGIYLESLRLQPNSKQFNATLTFSVLRDPIIL
jgi:hypothetical protein